VSYRTKHLLIQLWYALIYLPALGLGSWWLVTLIAFGGLATAVIGLISEHYGE